MEPDSTAAMSSMSFDEKEKERKLKAKEKTKNAEDLKLEVQANTAAIQAYIQQLQLALKEAEEGRQTLFQVIDPEPVSRMKEKECQMQSPHIPMQCSYDMVKNSGNSCANSFSSSSSSLHAQGNNTHCSMDSVRSSTTSSTDSTRSSSNSHASNRGKSERKKFSLREILPLDPLNKCAVEVWDKYEELGSGTFGTVFRCIDRSTGKEIAGKYATLSLPRGSALPSEEARVRKDIEPVLAEVRTMMRLSHERVLKCFGYQVTDRDLVIFTEFMPRGSVLDAIREKDQPLDEATALKYLCQATEGLVYIHNFPLFSNTSEALIHRDLKCDNLLLDDNDNVKLADFGASSMVNLKNGLTSSTFKDREQGIKGTLLHMAPEALQSKPSRKSDVWSIGCSTVEMLTTLPPHYEKIMASDLDFSAFIFQAGLGKLVYSGKNLCPNASKPLQDVLDKVFQSVELRPTSQQLLNMLHDMCPKP